MRRESWMVGLACLALLATGCGTSGTSGDAQSVAPAATATGGAAEGPTVVVNQFLEAIRTGNDEKAMSLLTDLARKKAIETNRSPTPPASDSARFQVGDVQMLGNDGARVACAWTDLDETGKPRTDRALWVCRREAQGWRVAGVAAMVFEGEDPLLLNFEDPDDMAKKQDWLREELARRAKPEGTSVQAEKEPQDSFRR